MERVERCRVGGNCMTGGVDRLDHIGIAAPDLAASASVYERLGFNLTALQQQAGPLEPHGPVVLCSSAKRCAMLEDGNYGIIGTRDPDHIPNQHGQLLAPQHGYH